VLGAGLRDSVVLDGRSVVEVSGIDGSLIGRNERVSMSGPQRRHRHVIGDHTEVEVVA
jgi:glucose-1-phosphate thymidylyltransferase